MTISPAVRISFGLVMFTLSVILIADLFGIIPKKDMVMLEARKKVCESLAVQLTVAASQSHFDIVKTTLEVFVDRNNDVLAASMIKVDGGVIAEFGSFTETNISSISSDDEVVVVPVYAGENKWGSVNIEFTPLYSAGLLSVLTDSILGVLLFVTVSCFIGYMIILRKALTVLDPKAVVPERVRTAFNTLAEGVMILDDKERIIMANDAFANKIKRNSDELLGVNVSTMKWKYMNREQQSAKESMPWVSAIKSGEQNIGVALNLSAKGVGVRSFSTNCAPILNDNGDTKGALVTFDDVTEVEETNVLLENAVTTLKSNELEIKRKNNELEILVTQDPLTGCYNRRAFFDLFEKMIDEVAQSGKPVAAIMLDIDNFKSINDRFGHAVGDEAIQLISNALSNSCDVEGAIIGRYGGEEFCVALPDSDDVRASNIAEKLRQSIIDQSNGVIIKNGSITASFGVSSDSNSEYNVSELLDYADKALYVAKTTGKNRVVIWNDCDVCSIDNEVIQPDLRSIDTCVDGQFDQSAVIDLLRHQVDELNDEVASLKEENKYGAVSHVDEITGLPTKLILIDRINQAMENVKRTDKVVAVAVITVDMFSRISETMGKAVGDKFLRAVGSRLKEVLRRSDTVATMIAPGHAGPTFSRLHDDEFALLITGLDDVESLTYIINRIQDKFSGKIELSGKEIFVTTSIGMSVYPQDAEVAEDLISNARSAQQYAKSLTGKNNFRCYSIEDNNKLIDKMEVEVDLHDAVENNQFQLFYQPKLNLNSGLVNSVEALIRWNHPTKGMVFPEAFIPIAEKSGMIVEMGKWCLKEACRQTKQWVDMGAYDIRTSVNVSALEFSDNNFKDYVEAILKEEKLDASHLEIELTESTIMDDPEATIRNIDGLRYLGVTVTLDDFGTGYSSLSYFGSLNLDWLKLDRSFLLEAMSNVRSRTMYSAIVQMANDTGVKVVSEGVETSDQNEFINSLGVDELQGYILSKAINAGDITNMLFTDHYKLAEDVKDAVS